MESLPDLVLSVSCATRPPRREEVDGEDYRFVSADEFQRLIDEGSFLEWAEVFGHRYGTLLGPIVERLEEGRDVILEIDVQGAGKVRASGLPATFIFLVPPSEEELARRLGLRDTESTAQQRRRLAAAKDESRQAEWFDHVVVNDEVDRAAAEVAAIISSTPKEPTPG
jgi:guanylate kinase